MILMRRGWTRLPSAKAALALLVAVMFIAACAAPVPAGSRSAAPSAAPQDRIHVQAHDALARWAEAVDRSGGARISFVGDLNGQIGDWEEAVGGNNKLALLTGQIRATEPLSDDAPGRKDVRWLDGASVSVSVLSAADTLAALVESATDTKCPDCQPLVVTDARLATSLIETSLGPAETPVWVFTIAGTSVKVTRVAVDKSITVVPPPWNADDPPEGISIESAAGSADSKKLQVSFTGAVKARTEPCGADYTAEAVESSLAVVVIVIERRNGAPAACDASGRTRTAAVTLEAPLGERAVLEVRQGLPVTLLAGES